MNLLLLHGLSGTGAVWDPFIEALGDSWNGPVLTPDLLGHGDGGYRKRYSFAAMAAAIAEDLPAGDTFVVGHSVGAVVGLMLSSMWLGRLPIAGIVAIGMKAHWSEADLEAAARRASRAEKIWQTAAEARNRHLRLCGLEGLVREDSPIAAAGIRKHGEEYSVKWDPLTTDLGPVPLTELLSATRSTPRHWLSGRDDTIATADALVETGETVTLLPGGHNLHVEFPDVVAQEVIMRSRSS